VKHAVVQQSKKEELIKISTAYNVLTQWTSYVAVEERLPNMEFYSNLSIEKLLEMENVDELSYISYSSVSMLRYLLNIRKKNSRRGRRWGEE
jgi:hypothetical protein